MKFLDQAKIYMRSGDGGDGAVSFRREKFIEYRRPRRRRRRPWRRRHGSKRRWPQHPDRLSLPAAFQGEDRPGTAWAGSAPAPKALISVLKVPAGTQDLRGGQRNADRRLHSARAARACCCAAAMAASATLHFKIVDQPRAAPRQSRPSRRGKEDLAAPEADRRRGPRRAAQCRQIDVPRGRVGGQAEDRRLSLHHTASADSAWCASTGASSCSPTFRA